MAVRFTLVLAGAALAAAAAPDWCAAAPQSGWPVCDSTTALDARSADIVARISVADKIQLLSGGVYPGDKNPMTVGVGAPSIGLPVYNWWSEATHGLLFVDFAGDLPLASNTALPITTSCAFNRSLWRATGQQIGREARAFANAGQAYSTFWTPGGGGVVCVCVCVCVGVCVCVCVWVGGGCQPPINT